MKPWLNPRNPRPRAVLLVAFYGIGLLHLGAVVASISRAVLTHCRDGHADPDAVSSALLLAPGGVALVWAAIVIDYLTRGRGPKT